MASASSPDLDITQDGNKFHFKLHSIVQTKETDFSVDEEFEDTQQNGVVMKVVVLYTLLHSSHLKLCHKIEHFESKFDAKTLPYIGLI